MNESYSKIKAYIGFAKKSGKIVFGTDDILSLCRKCKLALVSKAISQNALKKLENCLGKKIYLLDEKSCCEIFDSENIKAVAILDENLAAATKKLLG